MSSKSNREMPAGRRRMWLVLGALLAVALVIWLWPRGEQGGSGMPGFGYPGGMAKVVTVAEASTGDMPILFTALGTVIANRTVQVTSRVQGQLQEVAFEEGQHVEEGQLLALIDPRPYQATLARYQATLAQDQALLKSARQELARDRKLYQQKSLARQDLEAQVALVGQYAGAVKADQAQIKSAQLDLDYTRINSPISGYAGLRLIDPGNLVQAGDSTGIVTITQTDPIAVTFSLPQADLQAVLPGLRQGKTMPVRVLEPLSGSELAEGVLKFISNQIDPDTGTIKLKALFDNPDQVLYPNQAVQVRLRTGVVQDAVLVPQRAVQLSDQGHYVWLVDADATVTKRAVKVGVSREQQVVVQDGLAAGDRVVTRGVDQLDDGSTVKIESAQGGG